MATSKLLRRSTKNKTVAGVCGGIGEYFDIDPVLVRVGFVILTLGTGIIPGMIAYAVFALVIPQA